MDFDLFGMLENFLYSGHYKLPAAHNQIKEWHRRMSRIKKEKSEMKRFAHLTTRRLCSAHFIFILT